MVSTPVDWSAVRDRYDRATAHLTPPFAVLDLAALDANAAVLAQRSAGKPIRLASKSIRCRDVLRRLLDRPGYAGVMAYTLAEAIWLVRTGVCDDVLVGYPTTDRAGLAELVADPVLARAVTLTVDSVDHLDLIGAVRVSGAAGSPAGADTGPPVRLCLELDLAWRPVRRAHVGVRRSPLRTPDQLGALAAEVARRPGLRVVGVLGYEAQVAGLGDAPPGRPLRGRLIRAVQAASYAELTRRRVEAVAAVAAHADLEFVNGGGTGSLARTGTDPSVTELTAGSGLYGPALFDGYRAWQPQPAALFALPVVRRPDPGTVAVSGGGWIASGPAGADRLPQPWLPAGLRLTGTEGAGEVQTPLTGPGTAGLRLGDRVWFRHAKAGELCEHVPALHVVDGDRVVDSWPTYRGEGHSFLG